MDRGHILCSVPFPSLKISNGQTAFEEREHKPEEEARMSLTNNLAIRSWNK